MKREYGLDQISRIPNSLVTVGTFDGVHTGHQAILSYIVNRAVEAKGESVVLSFDPHPRTVLKQVDVPLLTTVEEKASFLEALHLDRFIVLPFTKAFAALSPEEFIRDILVEKVGMKEIVVGYDHGFGQGRKGDTSLLRALGRQHHFDVDILPAQLVETRVVSSTLIRKELLEEGAVDTAQKMLGRYYSVTGTVVQGAARGRQIGFPTANIVPLSKDKVIPYRGVYAVRVALEDGEAVHPGMMNIGYRPTFGGKEKKLEIHLIDFNQDLYGKQLRVEFVQRLRGELKFDSIEALIEQLSKDRRRCMAIFDTVT